MFTVQETTLHGQYRNVRVVELSALSVDEVGTMMGGCPYPYRVDVLTATDVAAGLDERGTASRGWTTWEVVSGTS